MRHPTYIDGQRTRTSRFHQHECPSCGRKSIDCGLDHRFHAVGQGSVYCANPACADSYDTTACAQRWGASA